MNARQDQSTVSVSSFIPHLIPTKSPSRRTWPIGEGVRRDAGILLDVGIAFAAKALLFFAVEKRIRTLVALTARLGADRSFAAREHHNQK